MRLIDADKLGNKVADLYTEGEEATEADKVVNDVIDLIDNAPTVTIKEWKEEMPIYIKDAMLEALRPQGEWLGTDGEYQCNKCYEKRWYRSNYCPQCGAYMKEAEDNES